MTPWRRPVDDIDSLFGREEAKARKESREEMMARLEHMERVQLEVEAKRKVETDAWRAKTHAAMIEREYRTAGVEPPELRPGEMRTSLALLLRLGWTIREVDGARVLVEPPAEPKAESRGSYQVTTPEPKK